MTRRISILALFGLLSFGVYGQVEETEQAKDSIAVVTEMQEQSEEELKAAERAQKKAEREAKKSAKLAKAISTRRKAIDKSEVKITKLQSKMARGKSRGKLSPVDEMEMNNKINKLRVKIAKDKEKLAKLERKQ